MSTAATKIRLAQKEFRENLRMLCTYYRSVADVCRKLNINRAQFNRYLNGVSKPSSHTLERICDFFGVEPSEIYLPRDRFRKILEVRPTQRAERVPYTGHVDQLHHRSAGKFDRYLGYYYEYYYSMSVAGRVLRGLVCMFSRDGATYYERIERFPAYANLGPHSKYIGSAFYLDDRIFLIDYECITGNEITQTILYPTFKNKVARLFGLNLGVSSGNQRAIACTRIVFEYLGKNIDVRKALRLCGLFDPRKQDIDPGILKAIDNSVHKDKHHFYTTPL